MDAQKKNMISKLCFGFLLYLSRGKYVHSFDKYGMGLGNTTGPQCLGGYTIKKSKYSMGHGAGLATYGKYSMGPGVGLHGNFYQK